MHYQQLGGEKTLLQKCFHIRDCLQTASLATKVTFRSRFPPLRLSCIIKYELIFKLPQPASLTSASGRDFYAFYKSLQ